ncbi:MAG: Hsp33 family molecular chaperone HslO [Eubacteriales bacterium]|nr:Hsp33 family molecular chaperone HslO [Eubacteriales bacterium]MDD4390256.1 Hsp33 family molecular chaperone HslO [Eubacteriales bacterium]
MNSLIAIDKSGSFRVYLAVTTQMAQESADIHGTTPLATAGLGRTLTGAGLMGLMLKGKRDKLTLIFKGEGPAKQILATANAAGEVKGYIANPAVELPNKADGKLDVGGSLGIGKLTVVKDLGLKEPYVGNIELVSGEIADDLAAYLYISEQQNSSVALGVKIGRDRSVRSSGGMIIQMLPDAEEGAIEALESLLSELPPMTSIIEEVLLRSLGMSEEAFVEEVMKTTFCGLPEQYAVTKLEERNIKWKCDCSTERVEGALIAIGRHDLEEIIEEDGEAELTCQFCLAEYHFCKDELCKLLEQAK